MAKIIAKKDFTINGNYYFIGDEIDYSKIDKPTLVKLNENGFIEPLNIKEILEITNKSNRNEII